MSQPEPRTQPILTEEQCVKLSFRASESTLPDFKNSLTPDELKEINLNWTSIAHFWVTSKVFMKREERSE